MMTLEGITRVYKAWNSTTVTCPKCAHEQDLADWDYAEDYVTYWGDDGPKKYCCPSCGHDMMIQERVMRSYTIIGEDEE
jgi:predicted RNA-binding Zn-ribbon protein involved in translation (DUF1610 family)